MTHQFVCGLLSARCTGRARFVWNARIREQGLDAFFDFYPTVTERDLTLRLAEMFHLERTAYLLSESLQKVVRPLLDRIDSSVSDGKAIDTVINCGGILIGFHGADLSMDEQLQHWIAASSFSIDFLEK